MTEPIPISGYKCPICKLNMVGVSKEEAKTHIKIPIDPPLPNGLVFKVGSFSGQVYGIITETFALNNQPLLDEVHSHRHLRAIFDYGTSLLVDCKILTSKQVKLSFREHDYRILPETEFEELKSGYALDYGPLEPKVRTTPELEEIVSKL